MGDAEIIPIGTRGRPGRATGTQPSAAARNLAGKSRPPKDDAPRAETPEPAEAAPTDEAGTPPVAEKPATEPVIPTLGEDVVPLATDAAALNPRLSVAEREGPGIPVGDWLAAFQAAAREVFGDQWEPQLAHFLAFLRRRLTGHYVVDEFGFDPEITERFFLAALRPIAQKWFRIEVRGAENIPAAGGALIVSNHSGTVPVDGLMTMASIHEQTGRYLRPLGADLVFRLPFVGAVARKGGATLACNE